MCIQTLPKGKIPSNVKLVVGLIANEESKLTKARNMLEGKFGEIDCISSVTNFTHTDYYNEELGPNLKRIFFSFKKLVAPEDLFKLKLYTMKIECLLSCDGKRGVNIDPGYITLGKLILFTTKDYSHRCYQNRGVYAEVTLKWEGASFVPWPWTYPDYRTKEYIEFFNRVREIYKTQITSL